MNILQVIGSGGYGGREIQPVLLACAMQKLGHNVFLLVNNRSQAIPLIKEKKLLYFELGIGGYLNLISLFPLLKIFKKNKIDIIHAHISKSLFFLLLAVKLSRRNIKLIFTQRMGINVKKNDFFHKYVYKHTNGIIAISEYVKKRFLKAAPFLKNRIRVIYNGIQSDETGKIVKDKKKFLNEFNIKKKDVILSLIGQLNEGKGHFWTLKSLRLLKDKYMFNRFKVFFIGQGELTNKIIESARTEGLQNNVIFTGFRPDVGYFYRNSDIILIPSRAEAFGNVIIEAMAFGKPVICSDRGAFPEIVSHNKNGFMVEYENAEALAGAVFLLVQKPRLRKKLGKDARKTVYKRFNFTDTVNNYIELYSKL